LHEDNNENKINNLIETNIYINILFKFFCIIFYGIPIYICSVLILDSIIKFLFFCFYSTVHIDIDIDMSYLHLKFDISVLPDSYSSSDSLKKLLQGNRDANTDSLYFKKLFLGTCGSLLFTRGLRLIPRSVRLPNGELVTGIPVTKTSAEQFAYNVSTLASSLAVGHTFASLSNHT
jgi:hypothetical protein